MIDVFVDSLLDSLMILPFLFAVYILIEVIEKQLMFAERAKTLLRGKYAPLIGVGIGLIPQCGFSIMASNLYISRKITLGTLIAVFIATSDEAIPILIANGSTAWKLLPMLGVKILYALFIGYLLDLLFKKRNEQRFAEESLQTSAVSSGGDELIYDPGADVHTAEKPMFRAGSTAVKTQETLAESDEAETGCCHHKLEKNGIINKKDWAKAYLLHPFVHSIKVFLFLFIITFLFGTLIHFVGQAKLASFLERSGWWQPFVAGLIGLIPNCASSVIIAQLYALGGLTFGSCVAGLCVNAGIGLALIFRKNSFKDSMMILLILYFSGVILGLILTPIPL